MLNGDGVHLPHTAIGEGVVQSLLGGNKRTKFLEGDSNLIFHKLSASNEQTPLASIKMTKEKVY